MRRHPHHLLASPWAAALVVIIVLVVLLLLFFRPLLLLLLLLLAKAASAHWQQQLAVVAPVASRPGHPCCTPVELVGSYRLQEGPRNGFGNRAPTRSSSVLSPFLGAASASALNYKKKSFVREFNPPFYFFHHYKEIFLMSCIFCHKEENRLFELIYFLSCASFV